MGAGRQPSWLISSSHALLARSADVRVFFMRCVRVSVCAAPRTSLRAQTYSRRTPAQRSIDCVVGAVLACAGVCAGVCVWVCSGVRGCLLARRRAAEVPRVETRGTTTMTTTDKAQPEPHRGASARQPTSWTVLLLGRWQRHSSWILAVHPWPMAPLILVDRIVAWTACRRARSTTSATRRRVYQLESA